MKNNRNLQQPPFDWRWNQLVWASPYVAEYLIHRRFPLSFYSSIVLYYSEFRLHKKDRSQLGGMDMCEGFIFRIKRKSSEKLQQEVCCC